MIEPKSQWKRVYIGTNFAKLLAYIVQYKKLRGKANGKMIVEQLLLAYAKQLASGMPEQSWRDNIIILINECEVEHAERFDNEVKAHQELRRRAAQ